MPYRLATLRAHAPVGLVEDAVSLFQAGDDALDRLREVLERHRLGAAARRKQRGLVDQVGEVGARESRRERRHLLELDARRETDFLDMDLQDLDAPWLVRPVDQHLAVE